MDVDLKTIKDFIFLNVAGRNITRKNPTLANEIEETSQGPPKPKRKNQENTAKDSHHS